MPFTPSGRTSTDAKLEATLSSLRFIKEVSDPLPPLKAVASAAVSIVEHIQRYKSGDGDWKAAEEQEDLLYHIKKTIVTIGVPVLLTLDNFETCWNCESRRDVETIVEHLVSLQNVSLVVTMRGNHPPAGAFWAEFPLEVLDPKSAQKVFREVAGEDVGLDADILDRLLSETEYLPQAIVLLARLVRKGESLSSLYSRWSDEQTALVSQGSKERHYNLDVSFQLSISSRPMEENPWALRLLSTIARLPNGISDQYLGSITCIPQRSAQHAARTLTEVGLVRCEADVFRAIAPIRLHIAQYHTPPTEDILQTREHYCELICAAILAEKWSDISRMIDKVTPELGNIHETLSRWIATDDEVEDAASIALDLAKFLFVTHHRTDIVHDILPNKHQMLPIPMKAALHHMHGMSLAIVNDYTPATSNIKDAQALYVRLEDEVGKLACTWVLGDMYRVQGRYLEARELLNVALTGFRQLGSEYRASQAACLWGLADALDALGECRDGIKLAQDALNLYEELDNQAGAAAATLLCAGIQMSQDNFTEALTVLENIRQQSELTKDTTNLRNCLLQMGELFCNMGRFTQAKAVLLRGQILFEERGSKQGLADTFRFLGIAALEEGTFNEARHYFEKAKVIYRNLGHKFNMADILSSFGDLCSSEGIQKEAELLYLEAEGYYRDLGCRRGVAACLVCVAKIRLLDGQNIEAIAQFREAADLYTYMGNISRAEDCLRMAERAKCAQV